MFVSASTHCFADRTFEESCSLFVELEYDKLEIWLSDDSRRLLVQMQTHFAKIISLGLQLKTIGYVGQVPGAPTGKKH